MKKIAVNSIKNVPSVHKNEHKDYEYFRRNLVKEDDSDNCRIFYYEVPPGKSSHPYHYHLKNEEFYYIISGEGLVRTPDGNKKVFAGDYIFFPANENGAHKITNTSKTETLVYIDFDTHNDLEVAVYPDSEKVGIWGKNINKLYKSKKNVDYYEDE